MDNNASQLPATDRLDLGSDATADDDRRNKDDDLPMTAATLDQEVADAADVECASSASSDRGMDDDFSPLLVTDRLDLDPDTNSSGVPARRPRRPAGFFLAHPACVAAAALLVVIGLAAGAARVSARGNLLGRGGGSTEDGSLRFPGTAKRPSLPDAEDRESSPHTAEAGSNETTPSHQHDEATPVINCLDPNGPEPYILMTLGRSGSSSTWEIISNLSGNGSPGEEYPGENFKTAESLLKEKAGGGGKWVLDKLCEKQRKFPHAGVVGFKLKSFKGLLDLPSFMDGLEMIAKSSVKVVRSRRNPLDRFISVAKHHSNQNLRAHCAKGNEDCIRQHMEAGTGVVLDTKRLLELLEKVTKGEDEFDNILNDMGINHVSVTYEKLYRNDDVGEWLRIFQFLGVGPTKGLTREQIDSATQYVSTSNPHHNETLANFEEVKSLLQGTEYENLLH